MHRGPMNTEEYKLNMKHLVEKYLILRYLAVKLAKEKFLINKNTSTRCPAWSSAVPVLTACSFAYFPICIHAYLHTCTIYGKTWLKHGSDMCKILLRYARDMDEMWLSYDMAEICVRYGGYMAEICLICGWDMCEIWLRYGWYMADVCLRYR